MNASVLCPCCSDKLIHHLSHHRDYWFCRQCWQEMPSIKHSLNEQQASQPAVRQSMPIQTFNRLKKARNLTLKIS